jgi:hypothetical protein
LMAVTWLSRYVDVQVLGRLRQLGVHAGGCGEAAIRLRPALVFQATRLLRDMICTAQWESAGL